MPSAPIEMPVERQKPPLEVVAPAPEPVRPRPQNRWHDQWEMIVPKMARPARPEPAPAAAPAPAPAPVDGHRAPGAVPDTAADPLPDLAFTLGVGRASRKWPLAALAAGMVAASAVLFYLGGWAVSGVAPQARVPTGPQVGAPLPVGLLGWTTVSEWPRRLSLLSGSSGLRDFRLEFEATIENKALGWIFRAIDARNYYAMKLEIVTPGRDPVVVLKRFAVIDGRDRDVFQVPLPGTYRLDTLYKIRLDVLGDQFTAWVQDRKIDQWSDARLGAGSIGLFSEAGERSTVKGQFRAYRLIP